MGVFFLIANFTYTYLYIKFHASAAEAFLENKCLTDEKAVAGALELLDREVQPDIRPPEAEPKYRKQLTKSLLYKVLISIFDQ